MSRYLFKNQDGGSFEYSLIKKTGAKYLKMTITRGGEVSVTVPDSKLYAVSQRKIDKILTERWEFIMSAKKRYGKLRQKYPDLFNFSEEHYRKNRKRAEELIKSKVNYYCRHYDFEYNRISIRNQKTRWGSCSNQGNLNFSYRLMFLIPEEQDYIVVHELCHLKEQNHSRDFWALVEEILPEYKNAHKSIRNKS